jgi:predicted ATPase/DNA-binding SARP family transcriptional activator
VGQQPVAPFRTDKVRALLAYLAVEARPHRREALAALLWPDIDEEYAQKNLRNTLHRLRQPLQAADPALADRLLISTRQTIALDPTWLITDVQQFESLINASLAHALSTSTPQKDHSAHCADCLARLTQAAECYQGELLAGFTLADAPLFEEWLVLRREALHQQMVGLLFDLALAHDTQGEWALAQRYIRRLLALEPWREEAHAFLMRLLAQSGQRSAALAQYEQCRLVLRSEFGIAPGTEAQTLYEQIRSGDFDKVTRWQGAGGKGQDDTRNTQHGAPSGPRNMLSVSLSPPHPVTLSAPHNLPTALTPFIGRTRALAEIRGRLARGARLLTLVGPGGMGKTRLALEVGRQELAAYPDGVVFVALAALQSPTALAATLVTTLATTLGVALQGGDPRTTVVQFLQSRRLLLILDNFEHLLAGSNEAVELVMALLQTAPLVQILVTSREHLQLRSEQLFQVQPLTIAAQATLAEAAANSAVRLFVQSAQAVQADFQLTAANLAAVLRICRLVQGMPLGLELAAAQVGVLSLPAIADAIAQSAAFLAVEWHDLPERQRSMRAVFAWSWQLLTAEEQRVLRQMSIFQGGFERMAAEAVTDATLPLLRHLCHKSLVQVQEKATGEVRYTLHELVRQFAAEELHAAGEGDVVAAQHGRYYLTYLAARGRRLGRGEPTEASAEIQAELDNLRLAWQWAASAGHLLELEQASYAWWQFCTFQSLDLEGRLSFAAAVAGVRHLLAATAGNTALRELGERLLAKLLAIHANYLFAQGCDEEMAAQAQEAIRLGATSGGIEGEVCGTFVLGRAAQELEQRREAGELWQRTIQLVRTYQPSHPESELLHEVHWMANFWLRGSTLHFGDYVGSRTYIMQALQLAKSLGKRRCELESLCCLGQTDFFLFDFDRARPSFVAALDLARALGYRRSEIGAQDGFGEIARLNGDYRAALTLQEQAVGTAIDLALTYDGSLLLAKLIRLHCQLGNQRAAAQRYEQLTQLLAHTPLPRECQLYGLLAAALMAHYVGDAEVALHYAEQANQLNEQGGEILFRRVDTALILGHIRVAVGQWAAAAAAFQFALDAFQQFGNAALAAEPQAGLAQIALAQGDLAGARALVEAILPVLAQQPHAGFNSPFPIYVTSYQVLAATADPRGFPLLQQGYDLLQHCAASLDDASRHCFLTGVASHQDLVTVYQKRLQIVQAESRLVASSAPA